MRKNLLVWIVAALLLVIAITVTNKYNLNDGSKIEFSPETESANSVIEQPDTSAILSTVLESDSANLLHAADFRLVDLEGNEMSLQDLRGKNVYLNFWATWCKWCKKEMPDMKKIYDQYEGQDIVMLTVNVGEKPEIAKKYMTDNDYPFQVLLDADKSVTRAYEIRSIPVSLFLDKEGNIVHKRVGAMNEEQMQTVINDLLD